MSSSIPRRMRWMRWPLPQPDRSGAPAGSFLAAFATSQTTAIDSVNPDILATIARRKSLRPRLVIGFAAETEQVRSRRSGCARAGRRGWRRRSPPTGRP
jgi:DNA / pantothenate metabolism flavoprotein